MSILDSNSRLAEFVDAYRSDPEFSAAVDAATSPEDVARLAHERGIAIEIVDLQALADDRDVSDEELEQSAGGYQFTIRNCWDPQYLIPALTWGLCEGSR